MTINTVSQSLDRFLRAQGGIYDGILQELKDGKKQSHWMWFIFPQLRALGQSQIAVFYGIRDLAEATAYLANPVLSARLSECCEALLQHSDRSAIRILGDIDAQKLRSSMTLFALADGKPSVFHQILDTFFGGKPDETTILLTKGEWK